MATSNHPVRSAETTPPTRGSLRLRLAEHPGRDRLDGGWWPRTRDLALELAGLVNNFPPELGRIVRVRVSPPDWDATPRRIPVGSRSVKVDASSLGDTHVVYLTTSLRTMLSLLVVPSGFTQGQGEEALLAAATAGNTHAAPELLHEVTDHPDADPLDRWTGDDAREAADRRALERW